MKSLKILNSFSSFNNLNTQLEKYTKNQHTKLAGDIFELIVKNFLQTNPKYKTILKNVWLLKELEEDIKIKLNLPNEDEGIDLIAETYDGRYWAIQAKYRSNPKDTLTLGGSGGLATFNSLAFNYCKNISHGLICTTVDKPPKKIKLLKNIGFENLETWLSLDDNNYEGWKHLIAKSKGKIIKPKPFKPKPHQIEAIQKSLKYFKNNNRGKIIMPCGTGKSLAAFWIAKKMGAKKILIAVPSLALLQQTLKVWTKEFLINNIKPDWICVCSDESVKEDQDDFISYTYDLGIEVTTNKDQITKFLKAKSKNIKILFTTYQSGKVTAKGSKGFSFDLGIMDEAHKTVGNKKKPMSYLIHKKNIHIKKRLFMTATERLFKAKKEEYLSMDNKDDYGDIIYQLSFKKAINSKPPIISDYKVITFGISEPEIEKIYTSNKYIQVKKEIKDITAREFATAIALRKAIRKLNIKNAITFHRSIRRAENFRKQQEMISKVYSNYENIKTFHVSGVMPTNQRTSQMRLFAQNNGLMTNARCLTEGVDLPAIDCICFTDPKKSKVDIVQAAGRALRLSKGKKFGYIMVPIFIPKGQDPEQAAEDTGFAEVVAMIGALSTQDTRIAEYLRSITEGRTPKGGNPIDGITSLTTLTKVNSKIFEKSISLKIWDKIAYINPRPFEEAKIFVRNKKIKTSPEYFKWAQTDERPKDIPYNPGRTYENNGWKGFGDFLGTGTIAHMRKIFRSFKLAKKFAQSLNFKSQSEWFKFTKTKKFPKDLPVHPGQTPQYSKEWSGWQDFLGNNTKYTGEYRSYNDAKEFVQKLKLKTFRQYEKWAQSEKKPNDIPYNPSRTYDKEWETWPKFLGTGKLSNIDKQKAYPKLSEAKKIISEYDLNSEEEYRELVNEKKLILPLYPSITYKKHKGWINIHDFLGKKRGSVKILNFTKARKFVKKLDIKTYDEYREYKEKENFPNFLPKAPDVTYKNKGWKGWKDFLGTK